jgi:hypothetical protein
MPRYKEGRARVADLRATGMSFAGPADRPNTFE